MYTVDSVLTGPPDGTMEQWDMALEARGVAGARDIVSAYFTYGGVAGINPDLALAQACDECDWFRHARWTAMHNPAGIGITSDAVTGHDFGSVNDGIKAHLALLCCFAMGDTPESVRAWGVLEAAGYGGFHRGQPALGSLDGHWAVPGDGYAAKIAEIANGVIGATRAGPAPAAVTGEMVAAAALAHLGDTHEWDARNGDHPVSLYCEADVEDWCAEAGAPQPAYPTAANAGDAAPLNRGRAPIGALVFFRGPGWSWMDHVGISLGDGRTISGLASVQIADGWQDLASYRGWRMPVGVAMGAAVATVRTVPGNPYGPVGFAHPFSSRWFQLDGTGLALPMMGYPREAEITTAAGRRVQRFERGWYGTQDAPAPWDLVQLLPGEIPAGKG